MLMMASSWQLLPNALSSESARVMFSNTRSIFFPIESFNRSNQVVALTTVLSARSFEFRIKCAILRYDDFDEAIHVPTLRSLR